MNHLEKQMVNLLGELKSNYNVCGIKMEFEAEGTRMEEAMRLKDICSRSGLCLTVKIGGCEAVKDMFEAASLGAAHIVAPMVETKYALKKYLGAIQIAFSPEQREDIEFLINIETLTSVQNFEDMLTLPNINQLQGIVIGRVDLTGSMELDRNSVNGKEIQDISLSLASKAKSKGLKVVVGGAVSVHSKAFFQAFPKGHLDRFETRKVVFGCPNALANEEEAYLKAVEFEILWLKNKKAHYGAIHREDDVRLKMMEERYQASIQSMQSKGWTSTSFFESGAKEVTTATLQ